MWCYYNIIIFVLVFCLLLIGFCQEELKPDSAIHAGGIVLLHSNVYSSSSAVKIIYIIHLQISFKFSSLLLLLDATIHSLVGDFLNYY